jgi:hypothetical protein
MMVKWSQEAVEAAAKAWLESGNAPTNEQVLLNILNAASAAQAQFERKQMNERIDERYKEVFERYK